MFESTVTNAKQAPVFARLLVFAIVRYADALVVICVARRLY